MAEQRDATEGPKAGDTPEQEPPGTEAELKPKADHGEESYRGSGKLDGLVALITGGDSGIGRAVAIAFAREGAGVAIAYLDEVEDDDAQETRRWVEKAGRRCLVERFDVREPDLGAAASRMAASHRSRHDVAAATVRLPQRAPRIRGWILRPCEAHRGHGVR